jgi:hypothetical protein
LLQHRALVIAENKFGASGFGCEIKTPLSSSRTICFEPAFLQRMSGRKCRLKYVRLFPPLSLFLLAVSMPAERRPEKVKDLARYVLSRSTNRANCPALGTVLSARLAQMIQYQLMIYGKNIEIE